MSVQVITTNGNYVLTDQGSQVRGEVTTTVVLHENSASATVTIGFINLAGAFVAYPSGEFTGDDTGKLVWHGLGAKLAVKVEGIAANTVTVGWSA